MLLQTNDAIVHIVGHVSSAEVGGNIKTYEDAVITSPGTEMVVINRNRIINRNPISSIHSSPTYSSLGVIIYDEHFGAGKFSGGATRGESELVLKPNSNYIISMTNESNASADFSYIFDWYEA